MSVATELTKLNTNIKNAYDEISAKDGTIPQNKNTDNLPTAIRSIPAGGGSSIDEYIDTNGSWTRFTNAIIKIPDIVVSSSSLAYCFSDFSNLEEIGNITGTNVSDIQSMFQGCSKLTTFGTLTFGNITSIFYTFLNCTSLETPPNIDTSSCTNLAYAFRGCTNLKNVPVYDWSSATNLNYIFSNCTSLTDQSLDNILQSCISATSFTGSKSLRDTIQIPYSINASRIKACPHYQDFIDAGWTL